MFTFKTLLFVYFMLILLKIGQKNNYIPIKFTRPGARVKKFGFS